MATAGAHQELLREAHARVGRHFEAAQLEQTVTARGTAGIEEFIDAELGPVRIAGDVGQDNAEDAVDQPRGDVGEIGHLIEGHLQLVKRIVARLVDARHLAGRAEEDAGEEVRKRQQVILPIANEALEEIGAAQERAVRNGRTTKHNVVAAAGADVPSIEQEFFRGEIAVTRFLIEGLGVEEPSRASYRPAGD